MRLKLTELKSKYSDPTTAKGLFLSSKDYLSGDGDDDFWRAVSFYVVNKCSFSGLTESSSFSKQASIGNFSMRGIEKLPGYTQIIKDWKITNGRYQELLTDNKSVFT